MDYTNAEVREIIINFLDGTGGRWDWDDFISRRIQDPQLEAIRQQAAELPDHYPPDLPNLYSNADGKRALRELAESLKDPGGEWKPIERLHFPLLTISKRGELQVFDTPEPLQAPSITAFRGGFYDDLRAIESSGNSFRVVHTRRTSPTGRFRFLKPRIISVRLWVRADGTASFEQLRILVVESLRRLSHPWDGLGDVEDLITQAQATTSAQSLFQLLRF
jgi:hypothetical protein